MVEGEPSLRFIVEQPETAKIRIGPSDICNHGPEGSDWKGISNAVVCNDEAAFHS